MSLTRYYIPCPEDSMGGFFTSVSEGSSTLCLGEEGSHVLLVSSESRIPHPSDPNPNQVCLPKFDVGHLRGGLVGVLQETWEGGYEGNPVVVLFAQGNKASLAFLTPKAPFPEEHKVERFFFEDSLG